MAVATIERLEREKHTKGKPEHSPNKIIKTESKGSVSDSSTGYLDKSDSTKSLRKIFIFYLIVFILFLGSSKAGKKVSIEANSLDSVI